MLSSGHHVTITSPIGSTAATAMPNSVGGRGVHEENARQSTGLEMQAHKSIASY